MDTVRQTSKSDRKTSKPSSMIRLMPKKRLIIVAAEKNKGAKGSSSKKAF